MDTIKGVNPIAVITFLNLGLEKIKALPKKFFESLSLRIEQEVMVIRYVLFCRPSLKTVIALLLRLCIVGVACLVFASIQLSSHFLQNPFLNILVLCSFMFVVTRFVWEFGYTIQHVKRYGAFLAILMVLPLPLYVAIYAQSTGGASQSKYKLVAHSFTTTSTRTPKSTEISDRANNNDWYQLNYAQVGGLSFSYKQKGTQVQEEPTDDSAIEAAVTQRPLPYPNPFRAGEGTMIGYGLSKDLDLEINIYNMFGNLVEKIMIVSGEEGGKQGYNRIKFMGTDASGSKLSAGAYFFFILHEGKVLSKGKMAVIP